MRGLDPRIHRKDSCDRWIAGSSPAMTIEMNAAYSALLTSRIFGSAFSIRPR
jgi:hypothetical protein